MGLIEKINESSDIVPDSFLDKFEDFASGDVVLVLYDGVLESRTFLGTIVPYQGITRPYSLYDLEGFGWLFSLIVKENNINNVSSIIIISKNTWSKYSKYPAYLSYLIGHELGHAKNAYEDIEVYKLACIIQEFVCKNKSKGINWIDLPHERICDQYGLYVVETLFSHSMFVNEIDQMIDNNDATNPERLKEIITMESTTDFRNLKQQLIDFSAPFHIELKAYWEEDKESPTSISESIKDFDSMFIL